MDWWLTSSRLIALGHFNFSLGSSEFGGTEEFIGPMAVMDQYWGSSICLRTHTRSGFGLGAVATSVWRQRTLPSVIVRSFSDCFSANWCFLSLQGERAYWNSPPQAPSGTSKVEGDWKDSFIPLNGGCFIDVCLRNCCSFNFLKLPGIVWSQMTYKLHK